MTSQEITEFVNQPTPRKVPGKISRKVTNWRNPGLWFIVACFLFFIVMIPPELSIMGFIRLLNSTPQNRMTAQGFITSIEPTRLWGIGPTSYSLTTRFSTPRGDRITVSYVWRRSNIPGWGVIPETQNNPRIMTGETLSLAEPFPVNVEYFWTRPQVARAIGTRFSTGISDYMPFFTLCVFGIIGTIVGVYLNARTAMCILRNGLFATGYISLHKDLSTAAKNVSILSMAKQVFDGNVAVVIARFTDHCGIERESFIRLPSDVGNEGWLKDFCLREQPVGLLYLPDTNEVIITDLWLDFYPIPLQERNKKMN